MFSLPRLLRIKNPSILAESESKMGEDLQLEKDEVFWIFL